VAEGELIKVPYVQRVWKGPVLHLYFRKGDYREGPLQSEFGTQALKDEVEAIVERLSKVTQAAAKPKAGTVGGMLRAYTGHVEDGHRISASADFICLATSTQIAYQDIADELTADIGDVPLAEVSRSWVIELRDAWAPRGHRAANNRMQVLKNALSPAIDDEKDDRIDGDPFHKVKKVRRPKGASESHPIWDAADISAAIEDAIRTAPGLARAYALGRYAGFRRGTICKIPRRARTKGLNDDGVMERRLLWMTEKREVLCDKREDARLTDVLARTPDKALTIAYNADGHPWKERALNQAVDRHMARLAKEGKVKAAADETGEVYCPLTIHGLRHSRGVELARAGASDAEIMAQLEHKTDRSAKDYRRQAQRRNLADQGQDRIDNVVKLKAARAAKASA
jgi:integrase